MNTSLLNLSDKTTLELRELMRVAQTDLDQNPNEEDKEVFLAYASELLKRIPNKDRPKIQSLGVSQLMLQIVELWRSAVSTEGIPTDYEFLMTRLCAEYQSRTGLDCCTVASIEPLELWYDSLSETEKAKIKVSIFN